MTIAAFTLTLLLLAQPQAAPIDIGANSIGSFAFDWSGEYADGTPMAKTTHVEFHYQPVPPVAGSADGGHLTIYLPLVAVVGENRILIRNTLVGVPGGVYDLKAVLIGVGGTRSAHSDPALSVRVRVKNPDRPTALRVVGR